MNFLVAYDGSEGSRAALREAATLATASQATVEVVRLLDPRADATHVVADTTTAAVAQVVREWTAELERDLAGLGVQATGSVVVIERGEDIPDAIVRVARERGAQIIVISSRRASGFRGLVLGSVTQHVLRLAPCPVLVVQPPE
ncbi:MAG: universal stress protein [Dehalococcoidia bacterium]|nr:universal stress protein [Dehalococcoidia bacterium]